MSETTISLHVEPLAEGGYVATSPDVPGLVAQGRSVTETVAIAQDVARKILESCIEHGDPVPDVFRNQPDTGWYERHPVLAPDLIKSEQLEISTTRERP